MNKSEMVYDQKRLIADLIGCGCFGIDENVDLSKYDESMEEISCMLQYCIDIGDESEVSFWRKMLQQAKVEKRRAKKMIENSRMEVAYT